MLRAIKSDNVLNPEPEDPSSSVTERIKEDTLWTAGKFLLARAPAGAQVCRFDSSLLVLMLWNVDIFFKGDNKKKKRV